MKAWAMELKQNTKLKWNGLYKFKQKIVLSIESGSYLLKTASELNELMDSFKLRHEVFFSEEFQGIDFDKYDSQFDHLIIIHKESKSIIGTYRINCVDYSGQSYTEGEFNIDDLLDSEGPHLELGRACIHRTIAEELSFLYCGEEYVSI